MKIFLSYSFRFGHDLTRAVDRLISSQTGAPPITGRTLAGQPVDTAVQDRILQSDALISLVLKDPNQQPLAAPWSQSVNQEYLFAKNQQMRSIAVVEKDLQFQGMNPKEYIPYDPINPMESILRISETMDVWRREIGQEIKVQILPKALAEKLDNNSPLKCSHRYWDKEISTPWKEVQHRSDDEGTFVWLRGVSPTYKIELRVTDPQQKVLWQMKAREAWPMLLLKEAKNA